MKVRKSGKLVHGVGINDADYLTREYHYVHGKRVQVWICPYYSKWKDMLRRCYYNDPKNRNRTYRDCTVCKEWLTFSNFKKWMQVQEWEGNDLDKDLLKVGNKIYCPDYCIFICRKINSFIGDSAANRGECMIGVCYFKKNNKFVARCNNPFMCETEYLGIFDTEPEAHLAWKARKHYWACQLADSEYCTDPRLAEALRTRYVD